MVPRKTRRSGPRTNLRTHTALAGVVVIRVTVVASMEGVSIGQYRIVRKLGEGGMGAVWLGEHTLLGRRAAIKVLLPAYSANQAIVQRFFNEAKAVTAIADPGIVQVFDFGEHTDGSAFLVMELLEGEAMDVRLRRIGRFSPADTLRLMRQIATSLSAAHAKGVIHRDLKPENIFIVGDPAVTGGERPKILDFGIAKLAGDEPGKLKTRTGMLMGTPVYMSPEQCRGASTVDHRSDVYALGCVMFTMLTGRPPFEGEGSGDIIIAHVRDLPPTPSTLAPGLPPVIDSLVLHCLEKDPAARYQSMAELVHGINVAEQALHAVDPRLSQQHPAQYAQYAQYATPYPGATTPYPGATTPYPGATTPYPGATTPYPGATTPYPGATTPAPTYPTPYPHTPTPAPANAVTTLGSMAMMSPGAPAQPAQRRTGRVVGGIIAVVAVAVGAFVALGGGSKKPEPAATPTPADARAASPAAVATTSIDAAAAVAIETIDAGVPADAAAAVAIESIDAGIDAGTAQSGKRRGTRGGAHGTGNGSGIVDRGD